jgi:hypothetical protein
MDALFVKCAKAILVGIVLLRLVFVFNIQPIGPVDSFSMELAEGELEGAEKLASEEADEYFTTDPFHWGLSSHSYLLTHYTHLILGAEAHVLEIVTPPPQV